MANNQLTCQALVELVTAYLEGTLPASERQRFESHLDECPYCGTYLEQMRQTIRLIGKLSEESLDPAVREDLLTRFRNWHQE